MNEYLTCVTKVLGPNKSGFGGGEHIWSNFGKWIGQKTFKAALNIQLCWKYDIIPKLIEPVLSLNLTILVMISLFIFEYQH